MNNIKLFILILILCGLGFTSSKLTITNKATSYAVTCNEETLKKIPILNFGTFHFGFTNDANTTEFDEHNVDNQKQAHQIAEKLSKFKPTIILVETTPQENESLQNKYLQYLSNPNMKFKNPTEIELLAYELGRLSKVKRIFGIDNRMSYNYNVGYEIQNKIDSVFHNSYYKNPLQYHPDIKTNNYNQDLLSQLIQINKNEYLDFLITVNADILTHVGTNNGFEGADEATKYYQRNLRMYSNLNRIALDRKDKVFILMGASHTAFFRDFISRSPKYYMVDTFKYLN